ncbi:MAG: hypothetical protein LBU86_02355, partial [Oscillospiraceae bacterium]|nr:hypothetical protein [Oscillospiraceae bacterium]
SSGGVLNYEGEFFEDVFQGNGQLYDENGGLIYTGLMHAGEINYRAMVGATLAELDGAFAETPGIYYQEEGESCFFYEKAGVIVTVDCRTRVDEWKREGTDPSGGLYYMPGEETPPPENDAIEGGEAADGTKVIEVPPAQPPADNSVEPQSGLSAVKTAGPVTAASTRAKAAGTVLTPVNWVVMDPYTPESSEDDESEKADESSSASSAPSEASAPPGETGLNADRARLPETPESGVSEATADDGGRSLLPEFIERTKELYFEIDADVWQPESSLDKSKVLVKRVTVIAYKNLPPVAAGAVSVEDNGMPGVEDCVAIDSIRFRVPAAFAGVTFEIDKQNKLFRQVWNINYANRVEREGYLAGDLIFRYAYIPEDDSAPAYYSIEAQ